jgi:hypothetical protein
LVGAEIGQLVKSRVAVEKGTKAVISWDSTLFRERIINHLPTKFLSISAQK